MMDREKLAKLCLERGHNIINMKVDFNKDDIDIIGDSNIIVIDEIKKDAHLTQKIKNKLLTLILYLERI